MVKTEWIMTKNSRVCVNERVSQKFRWRDMPCWKGRCYVGLSWGNFFFSMFSYIFFDNPFPPCVTWLDMTSHCTTQVKCSNLFRVSTTKKKGTSFELLWHAHLLIFSRVRDIYHERDFINDLSSNSIKSWLHVCASKQLIACEILPMFQEVLLNIVQ